MTNTTLIGWEPPASELTWFTPVEVEDASAGLTACSLTDGRAIVMWPSGAEVHYAIVDRMWSLRANDVVTAPMIQTALTVDAVHRTTVFRTGGALYFVAIGDDNATTERFWLRIYQANSASNPTSWSLHGEIMPPTNYGGGYTDFGGTLNAGLPLVLGSGRWVISAAHPYRQDFGGGGFMGRDASFWYSDDSGSSWTFANSYSHGAPAHWAHFSAPQIVQHPASGDLLSAAVLSADNTDTLVSTDDGESWSFGSFGGDDDQLFFPFLDNGTDVFGVNGFRAGGQLYQLDGTTWDNVAAVWDEDTEAEDWSVANGAGEAAKFIVDAGALWYFAGKYLAGPSAWHVGYIGSRS